MTITPISPQTRLVPAVVPDEDLVSPEPPVFATVEEERLHRKQRLAGAFRLFARYQFDEGVAGHITARDPEFTDMFWVNPLGQNFGHIRVSDLVLVDHEGRVVHGRSRINAAAFAIHSALHAARPDVVAAAHSHSLYGKAFSTLGRLLDPITQDACSFYGQHALFDDYTGVVLDPAEGRRIAAALGGGHLVILRNHGLLTRRNERGRRRLVVHRGRPFGPRPTAGRSGGQADPHRRGRRHPDRAERPLVRMEHVPAPVGRHRA